MGNSLLGERVKDLRLRRGFFWDKSDWYYCCLFVDIVRKKLKKEVKK